VDVRGDSIRLIQRAHPDEIDAVTGAGVVTPEGDPADGTAVEYR
jgi:hypothetical protein